MGTPDGNGSSKGEGHNGALLVLRGGGSKRRADSDDRSSSLPSANALRPDSNLNLGWYRPGTAEEVGRPVAGAGERPSDRWSTGAGDRAAVAAGAVALDLGPGPMLGDPTESALGARRPTRTPATGHRQSGPHAVGRARSAIESFWRRPVAILARTARRTESHRLAVLSGGLLVVVLVTIGVVALEQRGASRIVAPPEIRTALNVGQLRHAIVSDLTTTISSLGRRTEARRPSLAGRRSAERNARGLQASRGRASHAGSHAGRASSPPVSHVAAATHAATENLASSGSRSDATSAVSSQGTTAVQETARQAPVQPVHHVSPAVPAGPAGLGSQVGGNCDPKCS